MIYQEILEKFPAQFSWQPEVKNREKIRPFRRIVILGMGGSRMAPDILNMYRPELDIRIHSDFGLPLLNEEALSDALIIANSYSGDTAEVLSGAEKALKLNLNLAVVSCGGLLENFARENGLPFIIMPRDNGSAPRLAVGYNFKALAELLNMSVPELDACAAMTISAQSQTAQQIAEAISSYIPLVYASERLNELAYIWKVIFNETAKIPAFSNRFPELNHNEINSFEEAGQFCVLTLDDGSNTELSQRISAVSSLLSDKSITVQPIELYGRSLLEKIFYSFLLAHQTALALATKNGIDPIETPVINKLKSY